jgi:hypothetical protein
VAISLGGGEGFIVAGSLRRWSRRMVRAQRRRRFVRLMDMRDGRVYLLNARAWLTLTEQRTVEAGRRCYGR